MDRARASTHASTRASTHAPGRVAVACAFAALASVSCERSPEPEPAPGDLPPIVDQHVHVLGPDVMRDWKSLGVSFSRPDSIYTSASTLLAAEDPEIERVVLVPMAHIYGTEDFTGALQLTVDEEQLRVARENTHVSQDAARFPARAVALCSAPALRPYAMAEFTRCQRELRVAGIKLHLASSQADLTNDAHLAELARIFAWADSVSLPVLLHFDPQRRGLSTDDVARFARVVLEPATNVTVVVAHLGGSGGYGAWTRSVMRTLLEWDTARPAADSARRRLYFDLSAVVLEEESEGVPATTDTQARALLDDLRSAGLDRFTFGSDYPVFDPAQGARALVSRVGLTADELAQLLRNGRDVFFTPAAAQARE